MISMAWSQCSRMTSGASQYNGIFAVLQYSVSSIAADSEMQKKVECGFQYYCEHKPSPVSSMSIGDSISSKLMESGSTRGDSENPPETEIQKENEFGFQCFVNTNLPQCHPCLLVLPVLPKLCRVDPPGIPLRLRYKRKLNLDSK